MARKQRQKETKTFRAFVSEKSDADRIVGQYFSIYGNVDNVGDRIKNGAFQKSINERKSAIKVLWQHDASQPPIGVLLDIEEHSRQQLPVEVTKEYPQATGGLFARVKYLNTPRGDEVYEGIKEGALTENSIGYVTIKQVKNKDARDLLECKLYDISPVNWGANSATVNLKTVAYMETGINESEDYNVPSLQDFTEFKWDELDVDQTRVASHYAWANGDEFNDLHFAHHEASVEGTGPAVWGGVQQAMKILLLGETVIPSDEERYEVWEHLKKHYDEFGKDAPSFELVNLAHYARECNEYKGYAELLDELQVKLRAEPSVTTLTPVDNAYLKLRLMEHNI